eukprot:gene1361-1911_t
MRLTPVIDDLKTVPLNASFRLRKGNGFHSGVRDSLSVESQN